MLIIAERINSSRKYIAQAISSKNKAFLESEAKAQAEAGANYIDVNAGHLLGKRWNNSNGSLRWCKESQTFPSALTALTLKSLRARSLSLIRPP